MAKRHTTSAQFRAQVPLESLHGESQIIDLISQAGLTDLP
jgi:hypothetical protein